MCVDVLYTNCKNSILSVIKYILYRVSMYCSMRIEHSYLLTLHISLIPINVLSRKIKEINSKYNAASN